ncbi:MAG: peroxide stress protein YaaA, partial [Rikenellaceae bacterium]|nr:peroxide stress protein YaaA [Rikenellaceae bacterium]
RKLAQREMQKLMAVSPQLARLNIESFLQWQLPFNSGNSYPSLLSFRGIVFDALNPKDFNTEDFAFAQQHLRILSGLYGALRPLDLMQPYRLEMGTKFGIGRSKNLYQYWRPLLTDYLNGEVNSEGGEVLVNLASVEYSNAVDFDAINGEVITPVFKEWKGNALKIITVHAKRARGLMTRFIIKNRLSDVEHIKLFDYEGYYYSPDESLRNQWVFVR